jgi:hypothetical protein
MHNNSRFVKILPLVAALFLTPLVTHADTVGTVYFMDGTANPSFTDTTGRATGSCAGNSCTVNIIAPQGYTLAGAQLIDVWLNAGTSTVKDVFCGDLYGFSGQCSFSPGMVTIQFVAEALTSGFQGGVVLPNGIFENTGNISWVNASGLQINDSLKIGAGLAAVPEPSSLPILVGLMALGLVALRLRRRLSH